VLQHVCRDRAREGFAGHDDGLECGLERGAPALPAFGVGRGRGGHVHKLRAAVLAVCELACPGCRLLRVPGDLRSDYLALYPSGLVDGLGHVERLREPAAVQPRDRVADLEPGILDRAREAVPRAGPAEAEQVPAWFQDT